MSDILRKEKRVAGESSLQESDMENRERECFNLSKEVNGPNQRKWAKNSKSPKSPLRGRTTFFQNPIILNDIERNDGDPHLLDPNNIGPIWNKIGERGREREMLRRKPSKIEVKIEDKEELEDSRKRSATASATSSSSSASPATGTAALLQHFDRNKDSYSKSQRIGLSSP
ncbi:Anaphase-promoting complex, subunit CDC26 [Dillenia turbinata]|uniref:Anaphase-promoting complex, subunit CDC26 n=1 Tax=Dillenia turbinata TaxID=194707 RepID=A0AAN8W2R0_9MAGN